MEEWNIKRTPMLHFCLLTSSLKPVRETCDVRRSLLHNVATEWRQTSAQTLHLRAGSDEPRERKQVGRRGDDISSGKEMTEGERARDRKRERLPKCRCKYCFMFLQRHTHLWRGRSLSRVSSARPSPRSPARAITTEQLCGPRWAPANPESKPSLQVQNAKSMQQAAIQNPCVRMTRELTSIQDVPERKNARYGVRQGGEVKLRKQLEWDGGVLCCSRLEAPLCCSCERIQDALQVSSITAPCVEVPFIFSYVRRRFRAAWKCL